MNYLDLLNDDLMEKVIGYVTESVENDLTKTTTNVNKLKNKLKHLKIDRSYLDDENRQYLSIDYDNVIYAMDEYLFDNFNLESDIIFVSPLSEYFGDVNGSSYIGKKMKNPTYLDVVIEANKAIKMTGDYDHNFLEGINEIKPDKLFDYIGIKPKKNIRYFEHMLGS